MAVFPRRATRLWSLTAWLLLLLLGAGFHQHLSAQDCQGIASAAGCGDGCCWAYSQIYCDPGRYCDCFVRICDYLGGFSMEMECNCY
jgi:hypothetical protein